MRIFRELAGQPVAGVPYHGVMSPETWGWSDLELRPDGLFSVEIDPDYIGSFIAHLNAVVLRTNAECEAQQQENQRAVGEARAQQARQAETDRHAEQLIDELTQE